MQGEESGNSTGRAQATLPMVGMALFQAQFAAKKVLLLEATALCPCLSSIAYSRLK